jgi:hypothetical protein
VSITRTVGRQVPAHEGDAELVETGTNRWLTTQLRVAINEKSAIEQTATVPSMRAPRRPPSAMKIAGQTIGQDRTEVERAIAARPPRMPSRQARLACGFRHSATSDAVHETSSGTYIDSFSRSARDRRELPKTNSVETSSADRPDRIAADPHRDARQVHGGQRHEHALQEDQRRTCPRRKPKWVAARKYG